MQRVIRPKLILAAFLCAFSLVCAPSSMASEPIDKIKAVFLFKFFDYVSWQNDTRKTGTLCTLGQHPFGNDLIYISKMKESPKLNVISIASLQEVKKCHVLYVHEIKNIKTKDISKTKNTLVVSSDRNALNKGSTIMMSEKSGRVHLSIDLKTAENNNVKISSRLLQIAEVKR